MVGDRRDLGCRDSVVLREVGERVDRDAHSEGRQVAPVEQLGDVDLLQPPAAPGAAKIENDRCIHGRSLPAVRCMP